MDSVTQYGLSNPGSFHIHPLPSSVASSKCKLCVVLGFTLGHSIRKQKQVLFQKHPERSSSLSLMQAGFHVHPGLETWLIVGLLYADEQRPKTLICTPRASRISLTIIHRLHAGSVDTNAKAK